MPTAAQSISRPSAGSGLTSERVLDLWGRLAGASPTRQALALLAAAEPEVSVDALAELPLGERDRRLIELRGATLGRPLECRATCGECGEELELTLEGASLLAEAPSEAESRWESGDLVAELRPPTSADLLAVEHCADPPEAERRLTERCLPFLQRSGQAIRPEELDAEELEALAGRLCEIDPMSELLLELTCTECGHRWSEILDVAAFFAQELDGVARGLLAEVHLLARAYGWRESEVLALPGERRRAYLDLVTRELGG